MDTPVHATIKAMTFRFQLDGICFLLPGTPNKLTSRKPWVYRGKPRGKNRKSTMNFRQLDLLVLGVTVDGN